MSETPTAEKDVTCGRHFGRHPSRPELVAICTLLVGHDGDCDNALPKSGAEPSGGHDAPSQLGDRLRWFMAKAWDEGYLRAIEPESDVRDNPYRTRVTSPGVGA